VNISVPAKFKKLKKMSAIRFPFGVADIQNPVHAATLAITITDPGLTILNVAVQNTGTAVTLNLTNVAQPIDGAILIVKFPAGTTGRNLTLGTGLTGPGITGAAAKTHTAMFVFMTDSYYQISTIQLN
jgi:hypothetical protein